MSAMGRSRAPMPEPLRGGGSSRPRRGFSLVEVLIAMAVAVVLMGVTLPSFADHWRQARRSDAVVALTKLQVAQEQYRAHHGTYAADLAALKSAPHSEGGYYELRLQEVQPHRYTALATARADGPQAADTACTSLTLAVNDGMAESGPHARCWNQ